MLQYIDENQICYSTKNEIQNMRIKFAVVLMMRIKFAVVLKMRLKYAIVLIMRIKFTIVLKICYSKNFVMYGGH